MPGLQMVRFLQFFEGVARTESVVPQILTDGESSESANLSRVTLAFRIDVEPRAPNTDKAIFLKKPFGDGILREVRSIRKTYRAKN